MIRSLFRFTFKGLFWICALLGGLVLVLAAFAYFRGAQPTIAPVPKSAVLTLELEGRFVENSNGDVLQDLIMGYPNSLFSLTQGLSFAAKDDKIKGVLISLTSPQLGFAQIQELRDALFRFRATGKKVYLFADTLGFGESGVGSYYLATACDAIWVQPMGTVGLTGLRFELPFLKDVFDNVGIQPEFGHRKEYKSAIEMFTHSGLTPANQEAMQAIVDSLMSQIVDGIAKGRNLPPAEAQRLIDEGPYLGQEALSAKLIDRMLYRDEVEDTIQEDLGTSFELYEMDKYAQWVEAERAKATGDKVAILFGSGEIKRAGAISQGEETVINNDETHRYVMRAINDESVKAIVYRINSPGGDPAASQTIEHILETAGKPVIISMSDMAASGGYWVACGGKKIVAQPGTLTGSIGVFVGKFSLKGLWEHIGVNWDGVGAGQNGDMWSMNTEFSSRDWVKINQWLDFVYQRFTALVSKSRNLPLDKVEKIAKGRVWTGEQAQALGLVDQLGGLEDAIALARVEAGLPEDAPITIIPKPKSLAEKVLALISGEETLKYDGFLSSGLAPFITLVQELRALTRMISPLHSTEAERLARQRI